MEALETTRWQRVHVRVFFQLQMFEKNFSLSRTTRRQFCRGSLNSLAAVCNCTVLKRRRLDREMGSHDKSDTKYIRY